jgi:thioesterase domain-containing protein
MGGTVALEMAQQLIAVGEQVSLVILLETYNPAMISRLKAFALAPVHFLQNIWFHCANLIVLNPRDRIQFVAEKASVEKARVRIRLQSLRHLSSQRRHSIYPHLQVKRLNDRAQFGYVPRTYPGRVAVIIAKGCFAGETDPSFGWADLFGDACEVHRLPIYPRGMLVEPYCRLLAELLNRCLEEI